MCRKAFAAVLMSIVFLLFWNPALAQFSQQGPKLVGTGAVGIAGQGLSVSLSADGNTAIVGGPADNSYAGAAWVWTRSGAVWIQQGTKLVGSGSVGTAYQGYSVSLSADGNTAIVGGYYDNGSAGAAWVWTRSGGVWTQQGTKLVGSGAVGTVYQGFSVSLSADGNTAIVGGPKDSSNAGAAWVWTRSAGVWTQQGTKLVGSGAVGAANQGLSVSLSADGNTAIVGGDYDNSQAGAAWVWTRSAGVWTQQGTKLVGSGAVGNAGQGWSVSLSADGNTAIVGGNSDNGYAGAAWVWTRSAGVWTQQGSKLVGSGAVGVASQGASVSLSADGNTAIVGGDNDNDSNPGHSGGNAGAAWVWTRSAGVWTQQGSKLVGSGAVGAADQSCSVSLSADGNTAIVGGPADNSLAGAAWVFVAGGCTAPSITGQPQSQTIASGQTATLFVTATGDATLSYQWYEGTSGTTTTPVGTDSNTYTTPALTATTSYWVRITNACGHADSSTATVTVGTCPAIALSPVSLPNGIVAVAYSQPITATGGTGPYSYAKTSGALPLGLTLSTGGNLSGTPTTAGPYTFTVTATDSSAQHCTGGRVYTVQINPVSCPTIALSPVSLPNGAAGTAYSQTISSSGGTAPYTYGYMGALPAGLSLSAAGVLAGTPAGAGTFSFTVTATDANSCAGSQAYALIISASCPAITLSPSSLPAGTTGAAYSQAITATGGTAPYTFAMTSGSLPPGLSLTSGGLLSGTPTAPGTFNFTVTATDANGCTGSKAYSVTVVNPPVISLMKKVAPPFKIVVKGSNLQNGIKVYINNALWSSVLWKNTGKIKLTGGKSLKLAVPKGTPKTFRFVNPDGGEVTMTWGW